MLSIKLIQNRNRRNNKVQKEQKRNKLLSKLKKSFKSFFGSIFPFPEIVLDSGLNPSCLFHTRANTEENCILCLGSDRAQSQVNLSSTMLGKQELNSTRVTIS
jgi:hypothetical protein